MCIEHGGGNRCEFPCCTALIAQATATIFRHPETRQYICTWGARATVSNAVFSNDFDEVDRLMEYFKFKRKLVLRAENEFYHKLALFAAGLRETNFFKVYLDMPASVVNGDGKICKAPRADYLHVHGQGANAIAILGEFDENDDHEDEWGRFERIAKYANIPIDRIYIYRVHARMNTNQSIVDRKTYRYNDYFSVNERGMMVLKDVATHVNFCIDRIRQGIPPPIDGSRVVYFNKVAN